ncbi:MAG: hypothetical protein HQL59_09350 [Magnetococcales bacterium]|nr:hypothetical protein [Magnetococcales bacterium]
MGLVRLLVLFALLAVGYQLVRTLMGRGKRAKAPPSIGTNLVRCTRCAANIDPSLAVEESPGHYRCRNGCPRAGEDGPTHGP